MSQKERIDVAYPNAAPRATLTFRVGIVGHRPNRLKDADSDKLRAVISELLQEVRATAFTYASEAEAKQLYSPNVPELRAITPLAEGTDRLFAEAALALGYTLCCPMPFAQEVYEKDFVAPAALEENSLERFRGLLARAEKDHRLTKFELNVDAERPHDPYGAAGRVVLNQSDLLLVVWDGHPAAGPGSTVHTMREAIQWHVPVIWIDAVAPHHWRVLTEEPDITALENVARSSPGAGRENLVTVQRIVLGEVSLPPTPPVDPHESPEPSLHGAYFTQKKFPRHPRWVWKFFRDLVGSGKINVPRGKIVDYVKQVRDEWPTLAERNVDAEAGAETSAEWTNAKLREHYAWSDKPADMFGDLYRGTYIVSYLLAAIVVALALLPYASGWGAEQKGWQTLSIGLEFVFLLIIIGLVHFSRKFRWHDHWIEYRILAELVRQLRLLIPLGGARPFPHIAVAAHLADYGDLRQTWMYWQMRAIARATGIPNARVTPQYLAQTVDYLSDVVGKATPVPTGVDAAKIPVVGGQYGFHTSNANRSAKIEHRLYHAGFTLLWLTVVLVLVHLARHVYHVELPDEPAPALDRWLTFFCAVLPAFGASFAGIENQGEFARIHKRSHAMANAFRAIAIELSELMPGAVTNRRREITQELLVERARKIAQLMVDEVADWRVVFKDRPQREP